MQKKEDKERQLSLKICTDINRILLNTLSPSTKHLSEVEVDVEPRHEAFWFVGGISPPTMLRKAREGSRFYKENKEYIEDPVDRSFQYTGKFIAAFLVS